MAMIHSTTVLRALSVLGQDEKNFMKSLRITWRWPDAASRRRSWRRRKSRRNEDTNNACGLSLSVT